MNIQKLMKQAQQMQERMQRELGDLVVEATAGGGMVKVSMSGHKHLLAVEIDPEVDRPERPRDAPGPRARRGQRGRPQGRRGAAEPKLGSMAGGGLPGLGLKPPRCPTRCAV